MCHQNNLRNTVLFNVVFFHGLFIFSVEKYCETLDEEFVYILRSSLYGLFTLISSTLIIVSLSLSRICDTIAVKNFTA